LPVNDSELEDVGGVDGEAGWIVWIAPVVDEAETPELDKQELAQVLGVVVAELEAGTVGDCAGESDTVIDVVKTERQWHESSHASGRDSASRSSW
jgi:hypothetical protein